jgi:protein involved in sex pheromone biosynthesis
MKKSLALAFAASTLLLAGCCTAHHDPATTKWEYQLANSIDAVNQMAGKGWSVSGFNMVVDTNGNKEDFYLMKRPKQ